MVDNHNSENPCYLEPRVSVLQSEARGLQKTVDQLAKDLWGNGEKGLDDKVNTLEKWMLTEEREREKQEATQAKFRASVRTNLITNLFNIMQALLLAFILWRLGWK